MTHRTLLTVAGLTCVGLGALAAVALAQTRPDQPAKSATPPQRAVQGFPDLVGGLRQTEGCLGVEAAQTQSGKNVIFAWFQDKKAALRWYYSDTHVGAMERFFGPGEKRLPLADVPDDIGPLMVIASITMAEQPQFTESSLPISQIAIEVYAPVTGGLFLGGRFAPDSLKVAGMKDYTTVPR